MKKFYIFIIVIIISIIVVKGFNVKDRFLKRIFKKEYSQYVEKYSKENKIDELLVYSIIKAESNFNEKAVSASGAVGLMQIMDKTAEEVAKKENIEFVSKKTLYNPEQNIKIGTTYFRELMEIYNQNYILSITAYNAGIGTVEKWINEDIIKKDGSNIENIPYKETNMYVRKIIRNYKIYKEIY